MSAQRIAIVTGAAQGIGRGVALRLADDGLDVAVADLEHQEEKLDQVAEEIRAKGRRSLVIFTDISVDGQVKKMISDVVDNLGGLDVMVANAGVFFFGSMLETSVEQWDRVMGINARGVFLQYKYAAEQMVKQGRGGRIVGACSLAGKKGGPNMGSYVASKFAIRGITQTAAQEFAKHGITVNAYAPGTIQTDIVPISDEEKKGLAEKLGMPTNMPKGNPDDVAALVSYFVKPESHFVTGQTVIIDGGVYFD